MKAAIVKAKNAVHDLPIADVHPDAGQPRKLFDPDKLAELAASIRENGLLQPINVRKDPDGGYVVVAGERRWRAFRLLGAATIPAHVREIDVVGVRVAQIVENAQREDIGPIEQAQAYRSLLDETGWSIDELARRLGLKQPWRIFERLVLLKLQPEYQGLLASGNLSPEQAGYMAKLSPQGQAALFASIKAGNCPGSGQLRAVAVSLATREAQGEMFAALPPEPTKEDRAAVSRLERKIAQVSQILALGFDENEVVAMRKVDPGRAATYADKLLLIQKHLAAMEHALRTAAVQLEIAA
jgi:ParB family chromosome partitioning protein